jgi:DNA-binding NarL/FixJ family response regulator
MSETIRIIVADDHPVVRDGLVAILSTQPDFDVVAEADDGQSLIMKVRQSQPSVVVTDLEMPYLKSASSPSQHSIRMKE